MGVTGSGQLGPCSVEVVDVVGVEVAGQANELGRHVRGSRVGELADPPAGDGVLESGPG